MKSKSILCTIIIAVTIFVSNLIPCYAISTNTADTLKPKTKIEKKTEAKNVLKKFFKSMLLVCGSSIVIVLLLIAYKRFKNSSIANPHYVDIEKNLNTPETVEDATKFVIEKF